MVAPYDRKGTVSGIANRRWERESIGCRIVSGRVLRIAPRFEDDDIDELVSRGRVSVGELSVRFDKVELDVDDAVIGSWKPLLLPLVKVEDDQSVRVELKFL